MEQQKRSLCHIHLAVALFGLSGVFGKLIDQPAMIIVLGRVVFSAISLWLLIQIKHYSLRLHERGQGRALVALGGLLALHWCSFYQAIQLSGVAVGLLTFSAFPIFVTFLEPLLLRQKLRRQDVILAAVTFAGVMIVTPFEEEANMLVGVVWGLFSGLTYALLGILNKLLVAELPAPVISFYEQGSAAVLLLPALLFYHPSFTYRDISLTILLGVVFTALSHTLFIHGLRGVRAQTASIISVLEPIYGIVFAMLFLKEYPGLREILGGAVILGCAFYSSYQEAKPVRQDESMEEKEKTAP